MCHSYVLTRSLFSSPIHPRAVGVLIRVIDGFCGLQEPCCFSRPFHPHNVFYTLSTCRFSTGHHTFVGLCNCAPILALTPRIHVTQFVYSLYPRPPSPRIRNLTLSFNNVMMRGFLINGSTPDATRGFAPTVLL